MSVKTVSGTYSSNNGTVLPGFNYTSTILGLDNANGTFAPGLPFVFGRQDTAFRRYAANNNYLVKRNNLANAYSMTHTETFSGRATVEPIPSLKIELTANKTYARNYSSYITYDQIMDKFKFDGTPNLTGNFSVSTISLRSAFKEDNKNTHSNAAFDDFRLIQRQKFAQELAAQYGTNFNDTTHEFNGFSKQHQDVLIDAFLASYTGKSVNVKKDYFKSLPLPNWTIRFDGLGKIAALKKHLRELFYLILIGLQ